MLHEEVEKYINLSGDKEAWQNTSVSRIGGYLDGYDKGLEVLDKIRTEIEEYRDGMLWSSESLIKWEAINYILEQILDKYKAESEEP